MVDIQNYMEELLESLKKEFGKRLLYVGLQGSYMRGEETPESDIDIMIVLHELQVQDLDTYRTVIRSMAHADKSCGFICGDDDLSNWNPLEICHLLHTTKDYYGSLDGLTPKYTDTDVRNFVKLSINNLYHELCHRYVHAEDNRSLEPLVGTYKGVFFVLQNLYFLKTGEFFRTKKELSSVLNEKDKSILQRATDLQKGTVIDFDDNFQLLFAWCQRTLLEL